MPFRKILLTTDLSDESRRAFEPLARFAVSEGVAVTALHVVEDIPVIPHGAPTAPPQHAPGVDRREEAAREWLAEHLGDFPEDSVVTVEVIRAAKVPEAIAEFAGEGGFELIAMSTHGRTGFRRMVLGSVAEHVIRHADVPVLVFPRLD
jgi:nucleotide-binding universal stress UspA family protein